MPVVYFIYPETNGRSLEEINLLFTSPSLLVSKNEAEYRKMIEEAGGNVAVAERRLLDSVDSELNELDVRALSGSGVDGQNTTEKGHVEFTEDAKDVKTSPTPTSSN
jgi:hypothetical protein